MFFRKKKAPHLIVTTDLHSHILPGIDDGVKSMDESLELLEGMSKLGFKTIYLTPHIKNTIYPNNRSTIMPVFHELVESVRLNHIPVELRVAAEYYMDSDFDNLLDCGEELMTFPGNYILVENPMRQEPIYIYDTLFKIGSKGYKPILAHPERYLYYHGRMDEYKKLKHAGCLFQLNILSFAGQYGSRVSTQAHKLLQSGLADLVGSDIHSVVQLDKLGSADVFKALDGAKLDNERFS